MRPLLLRLALAAAVLSNAGSALAQDREPEATPAPTSVSPPGNTPPSTPAVTPWQNDYTAARERLLAGDFEVAAARFALLIRTAPTDADQARAQSMLELARTWHSRGLTLVRRNDLGESNLPARAVGERTTDEIAQLYLGGIVWGVGSGLWLASHTQPGGAAGVVLPMLLFSGVADGAVALADVSHPLRYGVAQSTVSGLYLGFEEGLTLALWNQARPDASSRWQGSAAGDVVWGFSTAGALGGALLGNTLGATPGRASFVGSTGLWTGMLASFGAAAFTSSDSDRGANALLAANIGLNAGIVGGLLAAGPVSPSIARLRFLDVGGVAGGLAAGGIYLAAADKNPNAQALFGVSALGIAAGLGVAWAATTGIPADRPEERATAQTIVQPTLAPVPGGGATIGAAGLF